MTFNVDLSEGLTILAITLEFKFEMRSFLAKYKEFHPDIPAFNDDLVLRGFLKLYNQVESIIFLNRSE